MCEEEQTVVVDGETKVEIKEDVDNDNWKKSLTDVLLEAAESRPIIKPDIKLLQKERETEIKDIVKRFQKLRAEKKSYESVLEQRRESIKQKQAALETQNVRNADLQGEISEVKSKLLKRGNLIYPANEFFASMGIRYEVSSSDDPFYKCHMKLSMSKIEPEPDRIFQVTFAYSTAKIEVLSVDPDELLDKVSDIAMEINGRLVNGKINSLLLLHELRTAFAGYLTQ